MENPDESEAGKYKVTTHSGIHIYYILSTTPSSLRDATRVRTFRFRQRREILLNLCGRAARVPMPYLSFVFVTYIGRYGLNNFVLIFAPVTFEFFGIKPDCFYRLAVGTKK